ncbi:asparaginase domain-containing protein, partial [Acinetobacter baumannii]
MNAIHIIVTGGTFDKEYNFISGELYFRETHLQELLEKGRSQLPVRISQLMLKDSLEMTQQDRELIVASCNASEEERIVITHGTDTMT